MTQKILKVITGDELRNLFDAIPYGKDNAILQKDLAAMFGITTERVKLIVSRVRRLQISDRKGRKGALLCSFDGGYYYPLTRDEAQDYYDMMTGQSVGRKLTLAGYDEAVKEVFGDER